MMGGVIMGGGVPDPYAAEYLSATTVSVPTGAVKVTIEVIGNGTDYFYDEGSDYAYGGDGGCYSRRNSYVLSGLTTLYVTPGIVRATNSSGTVLAKANDGGGGTTGAVGDVQYAGGYGDEGPGDNGYAPGPGAGYTGAATNSGWLYGYSGHTGVGRGYGGAKGGTATGGGALLRWEFE